MFINATIKHVKKKKLFSAALYPSYFLSFSWQHISPIIIHHIALVDHIFKIWIYSINFLFDLLNEKIIEYPDLFISYFFLNCRNSFNSFLIFLPSISIGKPLKVLIFMRDNIIFQLLLYAVIKNSHILWLYFASF